MGLNTHLIGKHLLDLLKLSSLVIRSFLALFTNWRKLK